MNRRNNDVEKPSSRMRARHEDATASTQSSLSAAIQTKLIDSLLTTTLWIAGFVGFWFVEGRAYRDAYLTTFGFEPTTLPWAREDLVYFGLSVGFVDMYVGVFYVLAVVVVTVLITLGSRYLSERLARYRREKVDEAAEPRMSRPPTHIEKVAERLIFLFLGAMAFSVFAFAMFGFAERHGMNRAKDEQQAIQSCANELLANAGLNAVHIVRLVGARELAYDGVLITCSTSNCGVKSLRTDEAQLVSRENLVRFETRPAAMACQAARKADAHAPDVEKHDSPFGDGKTSGPLGASASAVPTAPASRKEVASIPRKTARQNVGAGKRECGDTPRIAQRSES